MSMGLFTVYEGVGFCFSLFLTKAWRSFITFITLAHELPGACVRLFHGWSLFGVINDEGGLSFLPGVLPTS
jgi:hypothetical protein